MNVLIAFGLNDKMEKTLETFGWKPTIDVILYNN